PPSDVGHALSAPRSRHASLGVHVQNRSPYSRVPAARRGSYVSPRVETPQGHPLDALDQLSRAGDPDLERLADLLGQRYLLGADRRLHAVSLLSGLVLPLARPGI